MKFLVPMTGNGSRFIGTEFKKLKPLNKVDGKSMIEWVRTLVPDDIETIFICREDHLNKFPEIEKIIKKLPGKNKIYIKRNWKKLGPAFEILNCELIDDDDEVIVSYCDYFMIWDYKKFYKTLKQLKPDGAIPCYSGFHPHLLNKDNYYASCKTTNKDFLIEIREKHQFSDNKMQEMYSPGIYYFKSGQLMKHYIKEMISNNDNINGEYYLSLPYQYMKKDGLNIWCPKIVDYFCQWGTPNDLREYIYWNNILGKWK